MKKLVRNCNPIFIEMKEIFLVVFLPPLGDFFILYLMLFYYILFNLSFLVGLLLLWRNL